jgi:pimeloyl-ACP methyl ester carboxylesterase
MRVVPRLAIALTALVLLPPVARAAGPQGSVPFHRCYRDTPRLQCGIVTVPLDRAGRTPGSVPLHVARLRARIRAGAPRGAVIGLQGGPGGAALPLFQDFADTLGPALRSRDLVVLDQRGTGLSGLLRCPSLERAPTGDPRKAVQACAAHLGTARAFYTSRDSADDIEAVRQAEGVDKVTLYGISYGTKVALAYAQRYPQHVERLVLDSIVDLDGPDPFSRDSFQAIPRVLRELCAEQACAGITGDPVGDLAGLVKRLQAGPLRGYVVGGDGRRRARRLGRSSVLDVLFEGDYDPRLRSEFPAAVRSALAGDSAPLLRLARVAFVDDFFPPDPPRLFSSALFTATTCQEGPLPWDPGSSFGDRWKRALGIAAAFPEGVFSPFDRATARSNDTLRLCAPWPTAAPTPASDPRPLPDVPTLILEGSADLRTPVENAPTLAAKLPHASLLVVPKTGHAVLDSDLSGCALRALDIFFEGKPVPAKCPRVGRALARLISTVLFPPSPVAPASIARLEAPARLPGHVGRTVRAVELTFRDAVVQLLATGIFEADKPVARIGGLRNGRLVVRYRRRVSLRLDGYSYVRGVSVSAIARDLSRARLRLRVRGRRAARGALTFDLRKDRIRGRLGGRRVRLPLTREIDEAVGGLYVLRRISRGFGRGAGEPVRCCLPGQVLPAPR